MADLYEAGVTSLVYGWRLERSDGVTLGFTSHDQNVVHDGVLLQASPGLKPTTVVESLGLENDGLDVHGALTSDAIRAEDLAVGRWDGAYLEIFLFDWQDLAAERRLLACGELGSISYSTDAFEAEFLGLKTVFDRAVAPQTSPSCRAGFCDAACGLNRQKYLHKCHLVRTEEQRLMVETASPFAENIFAYGQLRVLGGDNCGRSFDIIGSGADYVELPRSQMGGIAPGTRVEIFEGCDKQIATCAVRFGNAVNFRGEPYLPGNDLLTRYPGAN
jgi:uncharacterized phage protein (TIGR02218 family)